MQQHVKILSWIFIVFGGLGILVGIVMMFSCGAITAAAGMSGEDDAALAAGFIGSIFGFLTFFIFVVSALELMTGIGLLKGKSWARMVGIVVCILSLLSVPIGTAIGIYGLWIFFSEEGKALFTA